MDINPKTCAPRDVYKLLTGMIVPRPIAFISTKSPRGINNLAPFSFYSGISSVPPLVMFCISERKRTKKDTLSNIENHPQFVINVVTEDMAQPMHNASADYKQDVSEFEEVGLTAVRAKLIDCMAVKESPIYMECQLHKIVDIARRTYMVIGEVINFHIDDSLYFGDYKIDIGKLKPLARIGGPNYARLSEHFSLKKIADQKKLIE